MREFGPAEIIALLDETKGFEDGEVMLVTTKDRRGRGSGGLVKFGRKVETLSCLLPSTSSFPARLSTKQTLSQFRHRLR